MEPDAEWQARMDEETYGVMYDQFAGLYLHCTPWQSFRKIFECGQIIANTGQFKDTYGQSKFSYCRREGLIAIFDLVTPSRREILSQAHNLGAYLYGFRPVSVAMELDKEWVDRRIVRAGEVREPYGGQTNAFRIPTIEAWIPELIPFAVVKTVRLIASGPVVVVDQPLTFDRLEAARVDLTQRIRKGRPPGKDLSLTHRLAERRRGKQKS